MNTLLPSPVPPRTAGILTLETNIAACSPRTKIFRLPTAAPVLYSTVARDIDCQAKVDRNVIEGMRGGNRRWNEMAYKRFILPFCFIMKLTLLRFGTSYL